jgi:hypothetical protein
MVISSLYSHPALEQETAEVRCSTGSALPNNYSAMTGPRVYIPWYTEAGTSAVRFASNVPTGHFCNDDVPPTALCSAEKLVVNLTDAVSSGMLAAEPIYVLFG